MSTSPTHKRQVWKAFFQIFIAYVLGVWTLLQFLEWILARADISPYWVDLILWINLGLLPSLLLYFRHHQRMNDFIFKRWEKFFIGANVLLLLIALLVSFRGKDFGSTTQEVTYVAANGREEIRKFTKSDFRTLCFIYNFEPSDDNTPDSLLWLGDGIRELLALDLKQDKALTLDEYGSASASGKVQGSKITDYYFDGEYQVIGEEYIITPRVHIGGNGKVIAERTFRGDDLLMLLDSISVFLRTEAGISEDEQLYSPDLALRDYTSHSLAALKEFCRSNYAGLENAIDIDPEFTLAHAFLGRNRLKNGASQYDTRKHLNAALKDRHRLPQDLAQEVLTNWHLAHDDLPAAEASLKLQLAVDPNNPALHEQMTYVLSLDQRLEELLTFTKSNAEQYFSGQALQSYADALLANGRYAELIKGAKRLGLIYPTDADVLNVSFRAQLFDGRWEDAKTTLETIKSAYPEYQHHVSIYERVLEFHQAQDGQFPGVEKLTGSFQNFQSERMVSLTMGIHGVPSITTDQGDISPIRMISPDTFLTRNVFYPQINIVQRNANGEYSVTVTYNLNTPESRIAEANPLYTFRWTEAHQAAKEALLAGRLSEAKTHYTAALVTHPRHFFLEEALKHIAYREGLEETAYQNRLKSVTGQYGGRKFWIEDGRLLYKRKALENRAFPTLELFPISDTEFISIVRKNIKWTFDFSEGRSVLSRSSWWDMEKGEWVQNVGQNDWLPRESVGLLACWSVGL
jgi:hypothetical protein